jgi:hypothetical protein
MHHTLAEIEVHLATAAHAAALVRWLDGHGTMAEVEAALARAMAAEFAVARLAAPAPVPSVYLTNGGR